MAATVVAEGTPVRKTRLKEAFNGSGHTHTESDITDLGAYIENVVEDTTPQLGGDLDLNGKNIDFPSTPNISDCLDQDDMSSNSATSLATQQSIKAYVDTKTVDVPVSYSFYDAEPARTSVTNVHGGLLSLTTAQPLDSVPTNIVVSKGTGKLLIVVNAGSDLAGDITVTGTSVNRNTGATTGADTDTITVDALTTDNSTTDSNGNVKYSFTGAYITSKWFTGSVTLSTTDLTLTDVDVYQVSFDQFNDTSNVVLNTVDFTMRTTNVAAEFDAYLYSLEVTGDKCDISLQAELHVGADGETAIADRDWRLRRGVINKSLDGATDGFWLDIFYSNSPAYVENVAGEIWATRTITLN